jgi:hypothetical protein
MGGVRGARVLSRTSTISGSLFSTKANMDNSNMQHLIDAETKREIARLHYDLAILRRRSWFLFFIPLIWFKVVFGTITVEIKEKRVKEVAPAAAPAPQLAPLDQFVFNRIARRLDKDLQHVEEEFFNEDFWQDDYLEK